MAHSGGMQEWVIQILSIPILVSVLFPTLHLKYFRIKFLLLVIYTVLTPHNLFITSNKNFILNVGMEKEQKQELGWRPAGYLYYQFLHSTTVSIIIMCCKYTVYSGMQEWIIQIPSIPILVSVLFPSELKFCY